MQNPHWILYLALTSYDDHHHIVINFTFFMSCDISTILSISLSSSLPYIFLTKSCVPESSATGNTHDKIPSFRWDFRQALIVLIHVNGLIKSQHRKSIWRESIPCLPYKKIQDKYNLWLALTDWLQREAIRYSMLTLSLIFISCDGAALSWSPSPLQRHQPSRFMPAFPSSPKTYLAITWRSWHPARRWDVTTTCGKEVRYI